MLDFSNQSPIGIFDQFIPQPVLKPKEVKQILVRVQNIKLNETMRGNQVDPLIFQIKNALTVGLGFKAEKIVSLFPEEWNRALSADQYGRKTDLLCPPLKDAYEEFVKQEWGRLTQIYKDKLVDVISSGEVRDPNEFSWQQLNQICQSAETIENIKKWIYSLPQKPTSNVTTNDPWLKVASFVKLLSEYETQGAPVALLYKRLLELCYGQTSRLCWNIITLKMELDKKPLSDGITIYNQILEEWHVEPPPRFQLNSSALAIAKENSYNPVQQHLDNLPIWDGVDRIQYLTSTLFNNNEPLSYIYLEKTLVGAIKRTYEPGCQFDYVLVLHCKQGWGKNRFFRILGNFNGDDFVVEMACTHLDKDALMTVSNGFIVHLDEIDRITSLRTAGEVKSFVTRTNDKFRLPYGKEIETFPRHCILVASVNKAQFLVDETGNRRFMVISIHTDQLDSTWLEQNKLQLWAQAKHLYFNGYNCMLNLEQTAQQAEANKLYEDYDVWDESIDQLVHDGQLNDPYTTTDLIAKVIQCDHVDKAAQTKYSKLIQPKLLKRGFVQDPSTFVIDGRKGRFWRTV